MTIKCSKINVICYIIGEEHEVKNTEEKMKVTITGFRAKWFAERLKKPKSVA